jgi:DNA-binding NtrC family response regulator
MRSSQSSSNRSELRCQTEGKPQSKTEAIRNPILVVDPDALFREELYNFLLAAGYRNVDSAEDVTGALERMQESEYSMVFLAADPYMPVALRCAERITRINPKTSVILLVGPEDRAEATSHLAERVQFLVKATFTRNLLYLLDEHAP